MDPDQQLRNLRDFLLVYNRMTDICFQRCSSNFNHRNLTMDEERCVDNCAGKLIRSNHRLMGTYVQLMPKMVQRRMEEMESKASQSATAAAPAIAADAASPSAEGAVGLTPAADDARPEALGSLSTPAGSDTPLGLNHHVSNSTTTSEVKLAATSMLNDAGSGSS
ncbi:mitochondrial import inner membrane translocase subunit Tim10 B-like [Brachionichthys hirsutus]|uniref:mitochondrial import inner membrane translocase subunit Tim10 B-like n=1 Tax=Brachionichthys hirsutus TaxID=412623 RepID=UPI0036052A6C